MKRVYNYERGSKNMKGACNSKRVIQQILQFKSKMTVDTFSTKTTAKI
jgi:hypothetical protein